MYRFIKIKQNNRISFVEIGIGLFRSVPIFYFEEKYGFTI